MDPNDNVSGHATAQSNLHVAETQLVSLHEHALVLGYSRRDPDPCERKGHSNDKCQCGICNRASFLVCCVGTCRMCAPN